MLFLFVCLFLVALHMEKEKVAKKSTDPEGCREQNTNEDVASKGDDIKPRWLKIILKWFNS